jgi:hypothetical protein
VAGNGSGAIDAHDLRALIKDLVDLQAEGVRLARRLLVLQEVADEMERLASRMIQSATGAPGDQNALTSAVTAAAAARDSNEEELQASVLWARHLERADKMIKVADDVMDRL